MSNNSNRISVRYTAESLQIIENLKLIMGDESLVGVSPVTNFALKFAHDAMKKIANDIHPGIRVSLINSMNGRMFGNMELEKQTLPSVFIDGAAYDQLSLEHLIRAGLEPFEAFKTVRQWDDVTRIAAIYDVSMYWEAKDKDWIKTLHDDYNEVCSSQKLSDDQVVEKLTSAMQQFEQMGYSS